MGACESHEQVVALKRHKDIEEWIKLEKVESRNVFKLLLLGASESGKTTILKQMRIIHDNGFSEEEIHHQKVIVYSNTVHFMESILKAMNTLNIQLQEPEREVNARLILDIIDNEEEHEGFTIEISAALKNLWADAGVQEAYARRHEFQLNDSTK